MCTNLKEQSRANYTMRRNADENGEDLPLGVKAVYKHFYMDDGLPFFYKFSGGGCRNVKADDSYRAAEVSDYTSG